MSDPIERNKNMLKELGLNSIKEACDRIRELEAQVERLEKEQGQ